MVIALSVLFTILFVVYSKWQFVEALGGEKSKWHTCGAAMRFLVVLGFFISSYTKPMSFQSLLFMGTLNILLWELLINKIALKTSWFHVGTTSKIDVKLGMWKWVVYIGTFILSTALLILT